MRYCQIDQNSTSNLRKPSIEDVSDDEDSYFEDGDLPKHVFLFPDEESSLDDVLLDCPRSSHFLWTLDLDLDPRSGPGPVWVQTQTPVLQCNYFLKKIFVINIHIYIIIQKNHLSLLCSPKWYKANLSVNILEL